MILFAIQIIVYGFRPVHRWRLRHIPGVHVNAPFPGMEAPKGTLVVIDSI